MTTGQPKYINVPQTVRTIIKEEGFRVYYLYLFFLSFYHLYIGTMERKLDSGVSVDRICGCPIYNLPYYAFSFS